MIKKAKSKKGNKVTIILLMTLLSCTTTNERWDYFVKHIESNDEISEQTLVKKLVGDTVNRWIDLKLQYFYHLNNKRDSWIIDDYIFFNSGLDKCIVNMPIRGDTIEGGSDSITILMGEKINGQWWFYDGPQYAVLRGGNYSTDTKTPLSLEFLTKRARHNALSWYYIEKPAGTCLKKLFSEGYESYKKCNEEKYIINDEYFEYEINVGMNPDPKKRIEWYLNVFLKNKFEPDTTGINQ